MGIWWMDLQFGQYRLKRAERQLLGPEGPVELSARSFDILALLLGRPDEVIGKSAIFDAVWPGLVVEENTLQVHISALRKALDTGMIMTVHGRGYKYAGPEPLDAPSIPAPLQGRRPVIAVLPFANLSDEAKQQYFSDGVTSDIIDRLTRYRILSIIAGREAGGSLSCDYVLSGNVRKSSDRIRIAARLSEAATEATVWAEHYDRPLADLFTVQDDVASVIARTLVSRVEVKVATRSGAASAAQLSGYDLVLQGMWHFKAMTPVAFAHAAHCFTKAIEIDPENAEAYRGLAICENNRWLSDFDWQGMELCLPLATRAVALDPTSAGCHAVHGFCRMWLEGLDVAAQSYDRALSLNPDDPHILSEVGLLNVYKGDLVVARSYFEKAFSSDPLQPLWYAEFGAVCDFAEGHYVKALPAFLAIPDGAWDVMYALACVGQIGDVEGAQQLKSRINAAGRQWDFSKGAHAEPYRDPAIRERLSEGIRMAMSF
jgi:TolB-like protein